MKEGKSSDYSEKQRKKDIVLNERKENIYEFFGVKES